MEIGEKIKQLRLEKKISQKELALKIGATQPNIAYFETRGNAITLENAFKIATALEVSIKSLLFDDIDYTDVPNSKEVENLLATKDKEIARLNTQIEELTKENKELAKELKSSEKLIIVMERLIEAKETTIKMLETQTKPLDKLNDKFSKGLSKIYTKYIPTEDLEGLKDEDGEFYGIEKISVYFSNDIETLQKIFNEIDSLSAQIDKEKLKL